jgi:hypothetical protein
MKKFLTASVLVLGMVGSLGALCVATKEDAALSIQRRYRALREKRELFLHGKRYLDLLRYERTMLLNEFKNDMQSFMGALVANDTVAIENLLSQAFVEGDGNSHLIRIVQRYGPETVADLSSELSNHFLQSVKINGYEVAYQKFAYGLNNAFKLAMKILKASACPIDKEIADNLGQIACPGLVALDAAAVKLLGPLCFGLLTSGKESFFSNEGRATIKTRDDLKRLLRDYLSNCLSICRLVYRAVNTDEDEDDSLKKNDYLAEDYC